MVISKKQLAVFLSLSLISSSQAGFQSTAEMVLDGTSEVTEGVAAMIAQGADYLLAPVACILVGKAAHDLFVSRHLPEAPGAVHHVEKHLPGGSAARYAITYLLIGGGLYKLFQKLVDSDLTGEFMQANMPNLSGLISYIQSTQSTDSASSCSSLE